MNKIDIEKKIFELNPLVYNFNNQIRILRKKFNFTQKTISKRLNYDMSCVVDVELGKAGIRIKRLIRLYELCNKSKKELFQDLLSNKVLLRFNGSIAKFDINNIKRLYQKNKESKLDKRLTLNIWKTDFRLIISSNLISRIKEEVEKIGGPFILYKLTKITPTIYYRFTNGNGSHAMYIEQLVDLLGINKKEAEKEILGVTYNGSKHIYPYIKKITPLMFRVVCHILGDGTIASRGTCRWIQKRENSYTLSRLIYRITKVNLSISNRDGINIITISAFFTRLMKYVFGLKVKDLKNDKIVKKVLELPKEYQIQFLAAFIVDEGHIRYKGAKSLVISQSNIKIIREVENLLNRLGYEHSPIKREIYKGTIYRINIYGPGVLKFYNDLKKSTQIYGPFAGLWHKQESLEIYVKTITKHQKYFLKEKLKVNAIINRFLNNHTKISYSDMKKDSEFKEILNNRSDRFLISKFYELVKKGEITRLSRGVYTKNNRFLKNI